MIVTTARDRYVSPADKETALLLAVREERLRLQTLAFHISEVLDTQVSREAAASLLESFSKLLLLGHQLSTRTVPLNRRGRTADDRRS